MSTDIQLKGDSRRRQLELSKEYADKNNLTLVESMEDIGISAFRSKNIESGSLGTFLEALKLNRIEPNSVLLVESLDRISRDNILTALQLFISILNYGIKIVTLADNQSYSKESVSDNSGQLFMTLVIMLRANDESETKSNRLRASWSNKRNSIGSTIMTSISPAWLIARSDKSGFEPIAEPAKTVKSIFRWSLDGQGTFAITRMLNEGGYPTLGRSKFWHKSYVTKILNNPAVYGEFQPLTSVDGKKIPSGPVIGNYYPMIVSKDDYLLSRARISERRVLGGGRKGKTLNNLFSKLIECENCGSSVVFVNKGEGPKGGRYLQCSNSKAKGHCHSPSWRYDQFELSFFKYVSEVDIEEINQVNEVAIRKRELSDNIRLNDSKIELANSRNKSLLSKLEDDGFPKSAVLDTYERINEIANEITLLDESNLKHHESLHSIESNDLSNTKALSELYHQYISSNSKEWQDVKLREKIYQSLHQSIHVIAFMNQNVEPVPYMTVSELNPREINFLKQGKKYSDEEFDDFILTSQGTRLLNIVKRSFVVYFKNGSVRKVYPGINISSKETPFEISKRERNQLGKQ
jgi:DNA invertase Pin-like site-specific DNA recombinase